MRLSTLSLVFSNQYKYYNIVNKKEKYSTLYAKVDG